MTHNSPLFPLSAQDFAHTHQGDDPTAVFKHKTFKEASVWSMVKDLIRPVPRPLDCMQVEVTSHCSTRCSYCPHTTEADTWQGSHMQPMTFANLWPLLQKTTRVHLQGWGEPFLHPHFFDFVALARKAGCLVSSTSCGIQLKEETALRIIKSGMDIVAFSLAGTDAKSNAVRHGADFEKTCEKILLLQEIRKKNMAVHLDLHIAYILLADRMEAVLKLPALLKRLGISTAIISTMDYVSRPKLAPLALTPEQHMELSEAHALLEEAQDEAREDGITLHYALPSPNPNKMCRENIQKSLYVSSTGDISPCVYLNVPSTAAPHREIFGNVNEEDAGTIWEKESFVHFRKSHADNKPTSPLCQTCVKRYEVFRL